LLAGSVRGVGGVPIDAVGQVMISHGSRR